jgi:hypothetical protein
LQGHSKGDLLILYIFEGDNKDVTAVDAGLISKDEIIIDILQISLKIKI